MYGKMEEIKIRSTKSLPSPKRLRAGRRNPKQIKMTEIQNTKLEDFENLNFEFVSG